jgi:competence protein ComEC
VANRPLLAAAAGVLAGTACGLAGTAFLPIALAAGAALAPRRRIVALACAAFAIGCVNAAVRGAPDVFAGPEQRFRGRAVVLDVERGAGFGTRFAARTADGRVLEVESSSRAPSPGAAVLLAGRLEPFDGARNPGEPDGRALAAERGLFARLARARILAERPQIPPSLDALAVARAWARDRVAARIEEPYASILAGALWGERGALPPGLRAEFQETGTMHVLITAGLHVGVIALLCALIASAGGLGRVHASAFTIAIVWIYTLFSGAHLPSLRAATMASVALAAHALGRRAVAESPLAIAAIAIALVWPAAVTSVSFGLSFSCAGAIVLFARPLAEWLARFRLPEFLREAIALTLATQAGTWPLTAQTFFLIAPYAPAANALVVPLTGAALLGGVLLLAATPFQGLAGPIADAETNVLRAIATVVGAIAGLPGAKLAIAAPPWWSIALYDLALPAIAVLARRGKHRAALALLALASAAVLATSAIRPPPHELRITVLDVGQGDGIVVQTPSGRAVVIDTGGRLERRSQAGESLAERAGARVLVPFLLRAGITHVDVLLLTHAHGDHVGGCAPILRTIAVDRVIARDTGYSGFAFRDCLAEARVRHVRISPARRGMHWTTDDGVRFTLLAPFTPPLANTEDDENENSAVVRVEYAGRRILLMGDAGEAAESRLLQSGDDLRADVLKVGHHGSATATTAAFVRAVAPRYAVISVGRDNTFGHPAPETIATLRAAGIEPARTDCDGAVTVGVAGDGSIALTPLLSRDEACGG